MGRVRGGFGRRRALAILLAAVALAGCGGSETSSTGAGGGDSGSKASGASAPTDGAALPNEGTKAVAPGVPTSNGGDNSIQAFGVESDSAERVRAATTAASYLRALADGRWAEACSDFSAATRSRLGRFAQQGEGCAGAMGTFAGQLPRSALLSAAKIHVLSMRVQGDHAFLIYRDGEGTASELPLARNGGEWKVAAISAAALTL